MLPTRIKYCVPPVWNDPFRWMDQELGKILQTPGVKGSGKGFYPVDVHEDDNHLYVDAELPGFKKDEIEVTLEKGVLTLNAERQVTDSEGEKHLTERHYTKVSRSFSLPVEVNEAKVEANLEDGVLRITLHKAEEIKPHKIEVK